MVKRPVLTPPPPIILIAERAKRADVRRALDIVHKAGTDGPVQAGDELPERLDG
jgi:hypothetical protein